MISCVTRSHSPDPVNQVEPAMCAMLQSPMQESMTCWIVTFISPSHLVSIKAMSDVSNPARPDGHAMIPQHCDPAPMPRHDFPNETSICHKSTTST